MVKTRHVNPADDHSDKEFVSLNSRKKKKTTACKNTTNGYESDSSTAAGAEEKTLPDDSPPRRHTRSRGKQPRRTLQTRSARQHKMIIYSSSDDDDSAEEEEEGARARKRCRTDNQSASHEEAKMDMYSRVKRDRVQVKRDMYGVPINDDRQACGSTTEDFTDAVTETEDQDDEPEARSYYLREHKPKVNLYEAPPIEPKARSRGMFGSSHHHGSYRSPARRSNSFRKKRRAAFHGSSSTSSSSCDDGGDNPSDDERRFDRRKAKSMAKTRQRCRPMNFGEEEAAAVPIRDRAKSGASLADVDPMNIDRSVTFENVGGMGKHIHSLKEMIVFPLLYPEVFDRFKIVPPRGVLFYGPPGTGKTLVARALANECSSGDKKVAFFMRKGADCLSKWVGESERQLRLLFDQAYLMRPSIIFFDEIDGLAPVRSSRQDQIHSSIVSTLLALMDGLDSRGEVVVIGATNRIDSIDPALRRPGRFDREFHFPLPSLQARKQILAIHTSEWVPPLSSSFLAELAERCVGYCGADLRCLCTEAALHALRRRYPQIYATDDRLQLDVSSISVQARDFARATANLVPATQRSAAPPARCLPHLLRPLLAGTLERALNSLTECFPYALNHTSHVDMPMCENGGKGSLLDCLLSEEEEEDADTQGISIYEDVDRKQDDNSPQPQYLHFNSAGRPASHRPRLLLAGEPGQGQGTHVGPALLYTLEHLPVHLLDLPALFAVSAKTPEESCSQVFREAKRTCPSVLYVPHIDRWWEAVGDTLRTTFLTLLHDLVPSSPLLLIATSDVPWKTLTKQVRDLFEPSSGEVVSMRNPTDGERRQYFESLLLNQVPKPPPRRIPASQRSLEVLPKAKPLEPRKLTEVELRRLREQEEATLRELRLFLRDVINKLATDRKFSVFARPVDVEEVPDYYQIIKEPMDLSTMMTKIDNLKYQTVQQFLDDISRICMNALQYNPDLTPEDKAIRHRACALRDTALTYTTAELDPEFESLCREIVESRHRRGELDPSDAHISRAPPAGVRAVIRKVRVKTSPKRSSKYVSPWCRPRRKVQYRKVVVYIDENGDEVPNEGGGGGGGGELEMENTLQMSQMNGAVTEDSCEQTKDMKQVSPSAAESQSSVRVSARLQEPEDEDDDEEEEMTGTVDAQKQQQHKQQEKWRGGGDTEKKVVVDRNRLRHLLVKTVDKTSGFAVEKLERLHSIYSHLIYRHRRNHDKLPLTQELESSLDKFIRK